MAPTRSLTRQQIAESICAGSTLFIYRSLVISASPKWTAIHPGGGLAIAHYVGRDATDEVEAYHSPMALKRLEAMAIATVNLEGEPAWRALTPPIALGLVHHPDAIRGHWAREGRVRLAQDEKERGERAALLDSGVAGVQDKARLGDSYLGGVVAQDEPSDSASTTGAEVITLKPEQLEPMDVPLADVDPAVEIRRSQAFKELRKRIQDAGLFKPPGPLMGYGSDMVRCSVLAGLAVLLHLKTNSWAGQMASATCFGLLYHQLAFIVHDAGHAGVTGNYDVDRFIGATLAAWIGGLSVGWWKDNHNVHHLVTNHPEHDPDIQHIPFFAISKDFLTSLWSTYYKRVMALDGFSKVMISVQHKLYYIVLSLARFNLYANSYIYLATKSPRNSLFYYEITGICFFWAYFLSILSSLPSKRMAFAYLLLSHIVSSPVHVQIVLSHFACSTEDLGPGESFASRQLRTTMDVVCGENIEFVHGGLHLQVTHHLFPRLPRHNLRKASGYVKEYCKEQGITYREHGFVEGNRYVLSTLRDVANQLSILKQVADKEAESGHSH